MQPLPLPGEQVQVLQPVADAPAQELANEDTPDAPRAQQDLNILSFYIFVIPRLTK